MDQFFPTFLLSMTACGVWYISFTLARIEKILIATQSAGQGTDNG